MKNHHIIQTTVEIFRTSVTDLVTAKACIRELSRHFPGMAIHFDLEDHDNILRMEGPGINANKVVAVLDTLQIDCALYPE